MAYEYNERELYDRALFTFQKQDQIINVAFEYFDEQTYMMIIFCDHGDIRNPHEQDFKETLDKILLKFDDDRGLVYTVFAF